MITIIKELFKHYFLADSFKHHFQKWLMKSKGRKTKLFPCVWNNTDK